MENTQHIDRNKSNFISQLNSQSLTHKKKTTHNRQPSGWGRSAVGGAGTRYKAGKKWGATPDEALPKRHLLPGSVRRCVVKSCLLLRHLPPLCLSRWFVCFQPQNGGGGHRGTCKEEKGNLHRVRDGGEKKRERGGYATHQSRADRQDLRKLSLNCVAPLRERIRVFDSVLPPSWKTWPFNRALISPSAASGNRVPFCFCPTFPGKK